MFFVIVFARGCYAYHYLPQPKSIEAKKILVDNWKWQYAASFTIGVGLIIANVVALFIVTNSVVATTGKGIDKYNETEWSSKNDK